MSYSCRRDADTTYKQWLDYCHHTTGVSNTYTTNGTEYMLELGREQRDGAMTGTVCRLERNGEQLLAYSCGSFRIEPDGTVKRYPTGLKNLLAGVAA
jgi:hypothetical protein